MTSTATKPGFVVTGRHVLIGMVLFFGIIIGLDTWFVTLAYRTFSGEVARNPYEAGLAYNRTIAQRQRESALGWTVAIGQPVDGVIRIQAGGGDGKPLDGLRVEGLLERPATEKGSRTLRFAAAGPGVYVADAAPLDGAWDLRATLRGPGGEVFEAERRLVIP